LRAPLDLFTAIIELKQQGDFAEIGADEYKMLINVRHVPIIAHSSRKGDTPPQIFSRK
jgi:hypothetical protein